MLALTIILMSLFQMFLQKYLDAVLYQGALAGGKERVSQRNTLSFCVPHLRQTLTLESASERLSLKPQDCQSLAYR